MDEKLALAERHVLAGRKIVARQRQLVEAVEAAGRDASFERTTLDLFERTLKIFEDDVLRLRGGGMALTSGNERRIAVPAT
jgi:hypothetical protein